MFSLSHVLRFPVLGRPTTFTVLAVFSSLAISSEGREGNTIWFDEPGQNWESESLPLGNGYMGASVLGGVNRDVIAIAEKTLWTGGPKSKEGYNNGLPNDQKAYRQHLREIQNTLLTTGSMDPEIVAEKLGHQPSGYGSYQKFADIVISMPQQFADVTHYERKLSLSTSVSTTTYTLNNVKYEREYFLSYPDNVFVVKLHASEPGKISGSFAVTVPENRSVAFTGSGKTLSLSGELDDNGLEYAASLEVKAVNGEIKNDGNKISVSAADDVVLYFNAATNYRNHYPSFEGQPAKDKVSKLIASRQGKTYADLYQSHVNDYKNLFDRVHFELEGAYSEKTTDDLLTAYKGNVASDSDRRFLETLYYQYGRYLLIASSRPGSLPANLQGVWNNYEEVAPWNSDYHFNINLQMNYWLADLTNLSELNEPLFDYVESLIPPGKEAAKALLGVDGWTLFLNSNIWGFSGTIAWPTAFWQPEAGAWIAAHFYDHYLFSRDETFLRERAWPVIREATEFWLNTLKRDPETNTLVVVPSFSPEHGEFVVGAAMSQQIVTELLSNALATAKQLNLGSWVKRITSALDNLEPGLRVGKWGQLQEWRQDKDDKLSHHRHVSQLYALHPGNVIVPGKTPELAKAAKVTLNARGDGGTGWSKAWKINFWARLREGDRAHKLLTEQLKESTLNNLWDNHPPFQIDGNFGATAGISEMLVQSHTNEIVLLPALPSAWPEGHIEGLKARGNVELDLRWKNGALVECALQSAISQTLRVNSASFSPSVVVQQDNGKAASYSLEHGQLVIHVEPGVNYRIFNSAEQAGEV